MRLWALVCAAPLMGCATPNNAAPIRRCTVLNTGRGIALLRFGRT